uniref:Putative carboxypeptidase inhibitor n=1 Tax=Rhipicephalus microplus TaxID=6941 RepID=A0A6G5A2S0_RHIMP
MAHMAALFFLSVIPVQLAYLVDDTCEGRGYICITFYQCEVNKTLPFKGCHGWKNCCDHPEYAKCHHRGGTCKSECPKSDIEHPYGRCPTEQEKCCLTFGQKSNRW